MLERFGQISQIDILLKLPISASTARYIIPLTWTSPMASWEWRNTPDAEYQSQRNINIQH